MDKTMNLEELKRPFQPNEHSFNYQKWAYVSEDAITERLDEVCGIGNWQVIHRETRQVTQTHFIATIDLQIMTEHGWVTRSGTGEGTSDPYKSWVPGKDARYDLNMGEHAAKGAATNALVRAARIWGMGRYLLDLPKDSDGNPVIKTHDQLRKWLIPIFEEHKSKIAKKQGNSPTTTESEPEPKVDPRDALIGKMLNCTKLFIKPGQDVRRETRWTAKIDYDDIPALEVTLFEDQLEKVDIALGWDIGKTKKHVIGDRCLDFSVAPLVIVPMWTKDKKELKVDYIPVEFKDNPAVIHQFKHNYPDVLIQTFRAALNMDNFETSEHDIVTATEAMEAYLSKSKPSVYDNLPKAVSPNLDDPKSDSKDTEPSDTAQTLATNYNGWATSLMSDRDVKANDFKAHKHVLDTLMKHPSPETATYADARQFLIDWEHGSKSTKSAPNPQNGHVNPQVADIPF